MAHKQIEPREEMKHEVQPPVVAFPKGKIKILLLEKISQAAVDHFVDRGYQVETAHILTKEELIAKLAYVHVIGVRSKTKLTAEVLKHAKKLMCVGCFCIGTDQCALPELRRMGVPVFNSPFANTRSVAELVLAQMIILSRRGGYQNRNMHKGMWTKTAINCFEVRGKTLGIIGYGHVGSQLSVLAEALGFRVIYFDIIPKLPLGNARSVRHLETVLKNSDFVSLHVPFTPKTDKMIGAKEIAMMKRGSYLVNAARGKCVDTKAAAAALRDGHLGGAYFDVFPEEPATIENNPLINCPNTVMTPHIGGSTLEAQKSIGVEVSGKIVRFIEEGRTIGAVNFPEIALDVNIECHRLLHIHRNIPGVLFKINNICGQYNISAQFLQTKKEIGYCVLDVEADDAKSNKIQSLIAALPETIKTRMIYSPGLE